MCINGQMGAVQERVAVYKRPPTFHACARSLGVCGIEIQCLLCPGDTAEH
ncbi:unnamed protein product [Staurois parvus]|uniref:Uncharacterized protein n=1 Tax=Staurois parvus TaxID=386267 RepID=A0ABN9EK02_9NEOB|nr:unnamed protein product [Staurois parvus]